ncbi:MAG: succinylglutamate desuccinylase [Bacteroidetes bacterium]|nr:succinylglutamate desuccinylase [Bacteroidota bacterium]
MERHHIVALCLLIVVAVVCTLAGREFLKMHEPDEIIPGQGVTKIENLSTYFGALAGMSSDTKVYILDSGRPGATALVLGGTHPNEPAGFMTAVVLTEHASAREGRLIVIPQVCGSGFTCTDPLEGYPQSFSVQSKSKMRTFRFGARGSNPLTEWPDPLVFLQYPSGQQLSGNEVRNLNRSYPGRPDGTVTERIAFAVMQLIERENVDIAFDLHEAAPEIPIINAIVTHEKGKDAAASALFTLESENLQYALEMSPPNFHGLSHREWGDRSPVFPYLMETSNPIQGRLRGKTNEALVVQGVDQKYYEAAQIGSMRITYNLEGEPLARRVGRHLRGVQALLGAYMESMPEKRIVVDNVPAYEQILERGIGEYLH